MSGDASHVEHVMGTAVSFTVLAGAGGTAGALCAAAALLHEDDATFSTWREDSPVNRLRRGETTLDALPPVVAEVLDLCAAAKDLSGGWFDPWAMPGGVDPTGLVKGWALERALAVLVHAGVTAALVNGGGDVVAVGSPSPGEAWRIGVRHPWRPDALACVVPVTAAVATSGTYERGRHLIDPFTGRPSGRTVSATVVGPSLAMADALATALAVGGDRVLPRIAATDGYEGYLIRPDGSEAATAGMPFADTLTTR